MKKILTIIILIVPFLNSAQSTWNFNIQYCRGHQANGGFLSASIPLKKLERGFLTPSVTLISKKDRYYSASDYNGASYLYHKNFMEYKFGFNFDYRISLGEKVQAIPSVGIFGSYVSFLHQELEEPYSEIRRANLGDGGFDSSISFRYEISNKIGIITGCTFTGWISKNRSAASGYVNHFLWRVGVTF